MLRAFLALALLAGTGCRRAAPGGRERLTVACTLEPESALVLIALAKGYFAAEGLDVAPRYELFGKAALGRVLAGQADVATVAETPVLFAALKGEPVAVLATMVTSTGNTVVVARHDAGIATAGDLKGKRIGFTPGTTSDFYLDSLLTAQGLTRAAIIPVPIGPDEVEPALVSRRVDAASTWNYPQNRTLRTLGATGVVLADREIYTETFNVAVRADFLPGRSRAAERFLRGLARAEALVRSAPEEARAIVAAATGVDRDLVDRTWGAFQYRLALGHTLLISLEDEARWAMGRGLAPRTPLPDFRALLRPAPLRAVKPGAVAGDL